MSRPSERLMASFKPVMLAIEPPGTKVPKEISPRSKRLQSQRTTRFSMAVAAGAWRQEAAFWFMAEINASPKMAAGTGDGFIMPK